MQELLVDFITSLDGYGAAEGWPGWWGLEGPEYLAWLDRQPERDYTILMGANTYRLMSGFATESKASASDEPMTDEGAAIAELARASKIVFSSSRWYEVAEPGEKAGARALIYLRRKDGVGAGDFRKLINKELVPALAGTGVLRELRTQTFLPWNEKLWDTPNVAHDNPADQRFHASLILGFTDAQQRAGFFHGREIESLSSTLTPLTSAIHAYDVSAALTYVKDGTILPHYQQ